MVQPMRAEKCSLCTGSTIHSTTNQENVLYKELLFYAITKSVKLSPE